MREKKKVKILIVEDEEIISESYARELQEQGFAVLQASNGKVGLSMALKEKPEMILLDILMPVMDGMTMMDKLRQANPYGKTVPIILLTNLAAEAEEIMKGITKNEPAFYLIKSDWDLSEVVQKIRERLDRKS